MEQQQSPCSCGAEGKTRIIYSCSGIGSNVGQLANAAACRLTLEGFGGGSCLAGVGGGIDKLIGVGKVADERIVINDDQLRGEVFFHKQGPTPTVCMAVYRFGAKWTTRLFL